MPRDRILCVDDEPDLLLSLVLNLDEQFDVLSAPSGDAGLEVLARESDIAVVISDMRMPGMDGVTFLARVRTLSPSTTRVLLTGETDASVAVRAINDGEVFRFLSKPCAISAVVATIEAGIECHRAAKLDLDQANDRIELGAGLDRALAGLWMAYQPIVRASDHGLYAYEALLRTTEPRFPHPGVVIEAAETLGRLFDLGRRVRASAAQPFADAPGHGLLFVNLHTRDLADEDLFSSSSALAAIAPRVVLEITERAALEEVNDVRARVAHLRKLGFRVAIDDLGAGYSGLTSFVDLEPDIVKLDMSLVRDVDRTVKKQRLVRSMTQLSHDLGILVVAEGVETREEHDTLIDLGCDLLQGYLLGRPGRPFPDVTWPIVSARRSRPVASVRESCWPAP